MSEFAAPIGPVCSICEQYEAIGSLMNLADYTTTRFCAMCGVAFLETILEALQGADTTPDVEPADEPPPSKVADATGQAMDVSDLADDERAILAAEPPAFPGTANVVRSTHGHRKGGGSENDDA